MMRRNIRFPQHSSHQPRTTKSSPLIIARGNATKAAPHYLGYALNSASGSGNVAQLKELIREGALVNSCDYDRRTPLHVAAAEGRVEVCEFLISQGANINSVDRWGHTPLVDALRSKHDDIVLLLKKYGAILPQASQDLAAQLCHASKRGALDEIKRLLHSGADVNAADYDGRTSLHIAAAEGRVEVVEFLLSNGANPNAIDRFGNTPLEDCARRASPKSKILQRLLEKAGGVTESDITRFTSDVEFYNELRKSLSLICAKDSWPYAEAWIQQGNQISCIPSWYGDAKQLKNLSAMRVATEKQVFEIGKGYIGQAWLKQRPEVMKTNQQPFGQFGIKSATFLPVMFASRTIGAIVLLDTKEREISPSALSELSSFSSRMFLYCFSSLKSKLDKHMYEEQMNIVSNLINQEKIFNANLIFEEVDRYYNMLGIPEYYFQSFSPQEIAQHILSFIAAKKVAQASGNRENIRFSIEKAEQNFYFFRVNNEFQTSIEKRIEQKLENVLTANKKNPSTAEGCSVVYFETTNPPVKDGTSRLGIYSFSTSPFPNGATTETETDLAKVASGKFMRDKTQAGKEYYQKILVPASTSLSPVFEVFPARSDGTTPLMIAFRQRSAEGFLTCLTQLLTVNGIRCNRRFIECFANGVMVVTLYTVPTSMETINQFFEQIGVVLMMPPFSLISPAITELFLSGAFNSNHYAYALVASDFCFHFLNQRLEEYGLLSAVFKADPLNRGRLEMLQKRLRRDAVTESRIISCIERNYELVKEIYAEFQTLFLPNSTTTPEERKKIREDGRLLTKIKKAVQSPLDEQILKTLVTFNHSVLKTNFFKTTKSALAFRLNPSFLSDSDLPEIPFALFFVKGLEFQGFHVRFRDVSRGGIRIIKSSNSQQYNKNLEALFSENYNLASTQQKKNKDIAEFGSKGTILLHTSFQFNGRYAFERYVDGLLDLMLVSQYKNEIVDDYAKEEILFLGPDEYTADLMDWAAEYAKTKGYRFWKSFTTGKSPRLGGIPHDTYGMTTRSIHRFVLGTLAKNNLPEESVTKVQIGGPDGDLGSNEIKISKDKTIAVVDGSGVAYDPRGLDRTELLRLAGKRQMVKDIDRSKLSPEGFLVLITDRDVTLPSGELVESGMTFRNEFHLYPWVEADLFVPCGGRPESINAQNVEKMFRKDGTPRFKFIIEGANLFLTQDARLVLEKAGVVIYKDASANKGGVTSSSLEVLAALSFTDEEFGNHMQVKEGQPPPFYEQYVKEVQAKVEENADLEFNCIWNEHIKTGTPRSLLTDEVSYKINSLNDRIQDSKLWKDQKLRRNILQKAIPTSLINQVGLENILSRVPENYVRAIFGAYLASRYVYQYGFTANEFSFFEYMYKFRLDQNFDKL